MNPLFPTIYHQRAAETVRDYFLNIPLTDTILLVNSCARGQAVAESDLDFAILVKENTSDVDITSANSDWLIFSKTNSILSEYRSSGRFAHLHVDIITGIYYPNDIEVGEPIDFFEVEIGNQVCYSQPFGNSGAYFQQLKEKWLPYYNEHNRLTRLKKIKEACHYDLNHIPILLKRGLYFHAFDVLYKSFQEYLQALFIANKTYPIAYNKWIKYQVVNLLKKPDLYPLLSPILSISNLESEEVNDKAALLRGLLNALPDG